MKKLLYSFLAAGAVAGLASCASDEPMMSGSNDGRVSISVEIPRFSTRAYGDTLNCNQLIYTVYDATGETVIFPDSAVNAFGAGINSANITLQLVPGETYTLVCYAHNTGSQFSSYKEGNITVDYTKLTANDENHDAFYRALPITVDGQGDKKITLNRAFAQINFGTNDLNNPAVQKVIGNFEAKLNITSGLYNTLSCKDSTVSNSDDLATTLAVTNNFTQNSNFPVPGYGNLTSVYVLVGADAGQLLGEGTYVINNGATEVRNVNLASTPVRMNYRTNVYGAMLTTDLPVTVELRPAFEEPGFELIQTQQQLEDAFAKGGNFVLASDMTLSKDQVIKPENSLNLNLGNHTLSTGKTVWVTNGASLTITGDEGSQVVLDPKSTFIRVEGGGEANIEGVNMSYQAFSGGAYSFMQVGGKDFQLNVKNCVFQPQCYVLATNATDPDQNGNVYFENVQVIGNDNASTPMCVNIPLTFTGVNCSFEGAFHAFLMRGGTYDFTNCSFKLKLDQDEDGNTTSDKERVKALRNIINLREKGWGSGNTAVLSAVTMGNHSTTDQTHYLYPTNVKMTGCTVAVPDVALLDEMGLEYSIPALYAYANQQSGIGVTFNYDSTTKFIGEVEYASPNIFVNGVETQNYKFGDEQKGSTNNTKARLINRRK